MSPKRRVIPVFIPHIGCPNDCVFCNQRRISGSASTSANADTVRLALEAAYDVITAETPAELAFYGGSFTAIPERTQIALLSAAGPFLKLNSENTIRLSTRPDFIDREIINRLLRYGVKTVELGAQSMCDDVLNMSHRGHTALDVKTASRQIKDAGISLILQMMTGLPGDTFEKSLFTAKEFTKLSPDGVRIYPAVIVRDTELYEMWRRGEYREHTVQEAAELCAILAVVFENAKIPIIRLGLNPTEELSGGAAVAGAYHPAFGELVYSRVYLNTALKLLEGVVRGSEVILGVERGRMSMMVGHKRQNIELLTEKFGFKSIKVIETDTAKEKIVVIKR